MNDIYKERSDVRFPLWRKKVDYTFLVKSNTPIPVWMGEQWGISQIFNGVSGKGNSDSKVAIEWEDKEYVGNVIKHSSGEFCLYLDKLLSAKLKGEFIMTYLRIIEHQLTKKKNPKVTRKEIDFRIPFWEFMDIEFDQANRRFFFKTHYKYSLFPEVMAVLAAKMDALEQILPPFKKS